MRLRYQGTPGPLLRALRRCAMMGLDLGSDADRARVQYILDREARRAEVKRILGVTGTSITRGGDIA